MASMHLGFLSCNFSRSIHFTHSQFVFCFLHFLSQGVLWTPMRRTRASSVCLFGCFAISRVGDFAFSCVFPVLHASTAAANFLCSNSSSNPPRRNRPPVWPLAVVAGACFTFFSCLCFSWGEISPFWSFGEYPIPLDDDADFLPLVTPPFSIHQPLYEMLHARQLHLVRHSEIVFLACYRAAWFRVCRITAAVPRGSSTLMIQFH